MVQKNRKSDEKVFGELGEAGYSDKAAHLIWLWYHPKAKCSSDVLNEKR
jgi:hypothetical protein